MAIRDEIEARMRQARKDKDEPTRNVIGMLKNKVLMELKSKNAGEESDQMWLAAIGAYAKQLQKAIPEFEKAGDRGQEARKEAEFELAFCQSFLPKKLDEPATEALIRTIAADNNISDPKMMGKLMGLIMKEHKDEIDGALARTIAARVLAQPGS